MNAAGENNKQEKATNLFVERDVLGQEKSVSTTQTTKASPNKIFIAVAVVIVVALVYWLVNHR